MDADRVNTITRWLWLAIFFEIGFLLMAAPLHVDRLVRALIGGGQ